MKISAYRSSQVLLFLMLLAISVLPANCLAQSTRTADAGKGREIQPWPGNPMYWQYKRKPVLLLGGTDDDNLFQREQAGRHLDSLARIGGNYIRNTMSDRDPGNERAFLRLPSGKYDLDQWNPAYWKLFRQLLREARKRDIIVQIEIWDRFDHSRGEWQLDPYNPKNNINYTYTEARLDSIYPEHPSRNRQPFFYTVPELDHNETLLHYQEAFVKKLLSISLKFDNVLYCMDNETSGAAEWGAYWADFIRGQAGSKPVQVTEMWDNWNVRSDVHKRTIDHPEVYDFIDISQNSQTPGQENWDNAQYVLDRVRKAPRPVNSTKIYGSEEARISWKERGIDQKHAVQTFCRNIIGGFAVSRFHRPPSGLGLNPVSANCIRTIREIENFVKMWDMTPHMELLQDNRDNFAYLSAKEGSQYLVYFTGAGRIKLDLSTPPGPFTLKWIDLQNAEWSGNEIIDGGKAVSLDCPFNEGGFALLYSP